MGEVVSRINLFNLEVKDLSLADFEIIRNHVDRLREGSEKDPTLEAPYCKAALRYAELKRDWAQDLSTKQMGLTDYDRKSYEKLAKEATGLANYVSLMIEEKRHDEYFNQEFEKVNLELFRPQVDTISI